MMGYIIVILLLFCRFVVAGNMHHNVNIQDSQKNYKEHSHSLIDLTTDLSLKPYQDFLVSSSLFLRPIFPQDHVSFRPIFTDETQMKYYREGTIKSLSEIEEIAQKLACKHHQINTHQYHWTFITIDGIAGIISAIYRIRESMTELSYCISPRFSGRGLTTEAARLVVHFISGPFFATTHPNNTASAEVLKKIGFKQDLTRQHVRRFHSIRNYFVLSKND